MALHPDYFLTLKEVQDSYPEYLFPRLLEDGSVAAILPLMFTTSIVLGLNPYGYEYRFCFKHADDAIAQLTLLKTMEDIPTGFIAHRPEYRAVS